MSPSESVSLLSLELARTRGSAGGAPDVAASGHTAGGDVGGDFPPASPNKLRGGVGSSYKDSIAKIATEKNTPCDTSNEVADRQSRSEKNTGCGSWAIVADCSSGEHHFAKKLVCGQEWCPVCSEKNSPAHRRRQSRILPKIQQISDLGYFTIEFPDKYRHIGKRGSNPDPGDAEGWCYNKEDLRATTATIVAVLAGKRCGRRGRVGGYFGRGLARWHWYGEKRPGKWNAHLNVLVESGHIDKSLLETIKEDLRSALNVPDLIVHYSYCDTPGQMINKLRYITKATFLDRYWDPYMAGELYNFRNMRWWGKWLDEPAAIWAGYEGDELDGLVAVSNLQDGICPDCGQPLRSIRHSERTGKPVHWSEPVDSGYLFVWQAAEISGSGYYRIPHNEWLSGALSPGQLIYAPEPRSRSRPKKRKSLTWEESAKRTWSEMSPNTQVKWLQYGIPQLRYRDIEVLQSLLIHSMDKL